MAVSPCRKHSLCPSHTPPEQAHGAPVSKLRVHVKLCPRGLASCTGGLHPCAAAGSWAEAQVCSKEALGLRSAPHCPRDAGTSNGRDTPVCQQWQFMGGKCPKASHRL